MLLKKLDSARNIIKQRIRLSKKASVFMDGDSLSLEDLRRLSVGDTKVGVTDPTWLGL